MRGASAAATGQAPVARHAALVSAMVAIAAAVAVAAATRLVHLVPHPHDEALGAGHVVVDVLCLAVAVLVALLLLAALTVASVPARRRGGPAACFVPRASPQLGAFANASVWATIAALAVGSSAGAFDGFPGGHLAACAVLAGGLGATTGAVHRRAHHQSVYRSFNVVAMLLAAGCLASMSLTDTGEWWVRNFSTLGTSDDVAAVWFNAGLVLSGGAMAAMAGRLVRGLARPEYRARRGARMVVHGLVGIIGFALAGVGLVPIDADETLHNVFASAAGAAFFLLAAGTPWLVRRMPRRLVVTSVASLVTEVAAWVVYDGLGLASLTVFEVVAFALVFVWLIALVVTTHPERVDAPALAAAVGELVASPTRSAAALGDRVRTATIPTFAFAGAPPPGMQPALARST
ncbi:hypothetical protein GCM10017608_00280 [Agromyces luteolus]|uniref:DUF998 domain-containing protein n=1 Tax=Agromyces luteolus TaxID=88373 RepID=A0A7C9LR18_9MICO|nr:hypothetical protein [Agromyces luteolus]MUN05556.1 hypothetical protein [Agromyces luteolus]GLK26096.1 hypothetical protein GCM10017608_00280 [Agromyces luteolus]